MSIDEAFETLKTLRGELPDDDDYPISESTTRFRIIDPILVDVLGCSRQCVEAELGAGEGEKGGETRLDYLLADSDTNWFVVEAKRRAKTLVQPGDSGKFKLGGPVCKDVVLPIAEKQMAPYLGTYLPRYGIVTNGLQWIAFIKRWLWNR